MLDVTSARTARLHLFTLSLQPSSPPCAQDRMGCSTSSQTSAVDTTRPSAKPEESNGASATGVANENGIGAEDSETLQEVTTAESTSADEPATAVKSVSSTAAAAPAGEQAEPAADAVSPAEAPAADSSPETVASSPEPAAATPEQDTEATAGDSVETTDPSE
ncbi:hypothetical protein EXN66_Car000582 [Channa argus]|uniref:Uncharacterized protein n=1 Tax=Channa argus TaxID=215402 RepID=A0A6G1QYM0_CHAAH|nr:hypothetical protein EXN66_Car000582 [Channa argus]KAK2921046.1 hypothetical protein Q8A73_000531 [Channa argus]